ncbi:BRO-N domain-containing protein [Eubacterium barkeri]|uniref:BRO-N domain-containing protein n=1 Tax=Eubacterium barkeri TaxID=1528 RepID=UPI00241DA8C2|nr:Bro-N domain-containing protein [Eubacterium barkeri]
MVNNEPWFVGRDVAEALGYGIGKAPTNAVANHVDEDDKLSHQISDSGQRRSMTIINESGLYSLILSSKLLQILHL